MQGNDATCRMKRPSLFLIAAGVFAACVWPRTEPRQEIPQANSGAEIQAIKNRVALVEPGTPRTEVLRRAGLTDAEGAKRISYYADICGSMEEWVTPKGNKIYIQGQFFDQKGYRKEPYVLAILQLAQEPKGKSEIIWSGVNLQTGIDIFATNERR